MLISYKYLLAYISNIPQYGEIFLKIALLFYAQTEIRF